MNSLYKITESYGEDIKHTGFDYSNVLLKKVSSNYIFKNKNLNDFLVYINDILVEYIESVKKLRVFRNYTVDKDYRKIN